MPMNELPTPDAPLPTEPAGAGTAVAPPPVECPGCGAKLRNVSAGPDAKIRCLNCGIRFAPFQAANATPLAETSRENAAQPNENKPKIREPKSAGYWLLRIPAILYAAGITCAFVGLVISLLYAMFVRQMRYSKNSSPLPNFEYLLPLLYTPLMPLSAYYLFVATRALARLEARTLKAAWNDKLIQRSLPGTPGSSLPYILPLAAGPTVLFIMSVVKSINRDYFRMDDIVAPGIASAACFFLAFMIDDFRQFIWRQKSMAGACAPDTTARPGTQPDSRLPLLGLLPALAVITFALMFVAISYEDHVRYQRYRQYAIRLDYELYKTWAIVVLTAFGCAATLFLTGRNFRNASNAWWRTASSLPGQVAAVEQLQDAPDSLVRFMRVVLIVFAVLGTTTMLCLGTRHGPIQFLGGGLVFAAIICVPVLGWSLTRLYLLFKDLLTVETQAWRYWKAVKWYLFLGAGAFFFLAHIALQDGWTTDAAVGFIFAICGGNLMCSTLAQIYAEVRRWRGAQTVFWKLRKNLTAEPALPTLPRVIIVVTFVLTIIQFVAFTSYTYYNVFFRFRGRSSPEPWEMVIGIPLMAFMTTFPTIWVALLAREFMLAEEMAGQLRAAPVEVQPIESATAVP